MEKEKERVIRKGKEKKFKKYRNKITDLLRISKQSYHQPFFEGNKKAQSILFYYFFSKNNSS